MRVLSGLHAVVGLFSGRWCSCRRWTWRTCGLRCSATWRSCGACTRLSGGHRRGRRCWAACVLIRITAVLRGTTGGDSCVRSLSLTTGGLRTGLIAYIIQAEEGFSIAIGANGLRIDRVECSSLEMTMIKYRSIENTVWKGLPRKKEGQWKVPWNLSCWILCTVIQKMTQFILDDFFVSPSSFDMLISISTLVYGNRR